MNYITTTSLRTQSSRLVDSLKKGVSVSLIHRSQIIGIIQPTPKKPVVITDITSFNEFLQKIKPSRLIPQNERENIYRQQLMKKYGKNLS